MNPSAASTTATTQLSKFTLESGAVIVILVIGIIFTFSVLFGVVFAVYMGYTRRTRQASREILLVRANNSSSTPGSPSPYVGRRKFKDLSDV